MSRVGYRMWDLAEALDLDGRCAAAAAAADDVAARVVDEDDKAFHRMAAYYNRTDGVRTGTQVAAAMMIVTCVSQRQDVLEMAHVPQTMMTLPSAVVDCAAAVAVGTGGKVDTPSTLDGVVEEACWNVLEVRKDTHAQPALPRLRVSWKDVDVACAADDLVVVVAAAAVDS